MGKNKVDAYSVLKGISIFLVVCIHVLYKFHGADKPKLLEALNYITGFAVPLFMIIGGFFLTTKLEHCTEDIKLYFKHLLKRILIPYYIFCLILTLFRFLTNKKLFLYPFLLIDAGTHGLYFIIIYVYSYTISGLLFYLISTFNKFDKKIIISIIIPLISFLSFPISNWLSRYAPDNSVVIGLTLISYFTAGFPIAVFCRKITPRNFLYKMNILLAIICFLFIYTGILYLFRTFYAKFPIFSAQPSIFVLIYSICIFLILFIILNEIAFFTVIGKKILFDRFGNESLFIFYIHPYFIYLLPDIFNMIYLKNTINSNLFVFPWVFFSYLIALISLKIYDILPVKIQKIFSR